MYNLNSHYENIFHYLKTIVTHRRVLYLHPFGSTQPENIESISDNLDELNSRLRAELREASIGEGPLFIFYDQEPIYGEFNYALFDYIRDNIPGPHILVTTEKESAPLDQVLARYNWPTAYYFHHVFAAHDWFRGYQYDSRLIEPQQRTLTKKYISFNRITSASRVYRSLFVSELIKRNILDQGYVSYGDVCPDNNQNYVTNLTDAAANGTINHAQCAEAIDNISMAQLPLRIDCKDQALIPNRSFVLGAIEETQESFCYVVTETCYWEKKHHLTEKIFKPIVSKMPFILVGPAHNLEYLRSYGFKTFSQWIDESYDTIEDPVQRLAAIADSLSKLCSKSLTELESILAEMSPTLEHNYQLFNSQEFITHAWEELTSGLVASIHNSTSN